MLPGLRTLSLALTSGHISASQLVENALEQAKLSKSVFLKVNPGLVRLAYSIDRCRKRNPHALPLAGIPIGLKDLFNVRNEKTYAGSVVRKHYAQPESQDATVVEPLREAGLLFFGRTNMSEFAFSGIGKNAHYGTPLSIWDRATQRLPGGSSSGSAVSIAEGVVSAALGTDTAGSCRIPAAFNGIVGVKPSHRRMSLKGIYPLSPSLDAPGPMAVDVDSCFILDQLICAKGSTIEELPHLNPRPIESLKLIIPQGKVLQDLDDQVLATFERAVEALRAAGADVRSVPMPVLDDCVDFFSSQSLVLYEVYQHHREMLEAHGDDYDPFVRSRILSGAEISLTEQQQRHQMRDRLIASFEQQFIRLDVDAMIYPTVVCIPPKLVDCENDDSAAKINMRCLRNTATVNQFDGCSISLPCHRRNEAPVGLMLSSRNGEDQSLYEVAASVESVLLNS